MADAISFNQAITLALIAASPALLSLVVSLFNRKKINDVHILINSRLDQLLKVSKSASRAEGHIEGQEHERQDEQDRKDKEK